MSLRPSVVGLVGMSKVKQSSRISVVLIVHALDARGGFVTRMGPVIGVARLARATGVPAHAIAERLLRAQPSPWLDGVVAGAALAESRALFDARIAASDLRALRPQISRCTSRRGAIVLPLWACGHESSACSPAHMPAHLTQAAEAPHALSPSIVRAADAALERALVRDPLVVRLFAGGEPLRAAAARALAEQAAWPCHASDGPRLAVAALLPDAFTERALVFALRLCAQRVAHLAPHRDAPDEAACSALAAELLAARAVVGHGGGLLRFEGDALRAWLEGHAGARWRRPWSVYRLRRAGARRVVSARAAEPQSLRWRDADLVDEAISRAIGSAARAPEIAVCADALAALGFAIERAEVRASARDAMRLATIEACAARLAARLSVVGSAAG